VLTYLFEFIFSPNADGVIRKKSITQKQINDGGGTSRKHLGTPYAPPANSLLQPNPFLLLNSLVATSVHHQPQSLTRGGTPSSPPEGPHSSSTLHPTRHLNGHASLLELNRKRKFSQNGFQTDGWGLPIKSPGKAGVQSNMATYTAFKKKRIAHGSTGGAEDNLAAISIEANQSDLLDLIQSFIHPGNALSLAHSTMSLTWDSLGQTERMEALADVYLIFLTRVQDPRPTFDQFSIPLFDQIANDATLTLPISP